MSIKKALAVQTLPTWQKMSFLILWGFGSESEDDPQNIGDETIHKFIFSDMQHRKPGSG